MPARVFPEVCPPLPVESAPALDRPDERTTHVHITKDRIPSKIDAPGAHARQQPDFGGVASDATLGAEYLSLGTGTDIAPLLHGLPDDACDAPHWGYVVSGTVVVTYTDGHEETCTGNDLFHWPAGHSVRVVDAAELVMFSPQAEHGAVMDHMLAAMAG